MPAEELPTAELTADLDLDEALVDGGDYTGLVAEGAITGCVVRGANLSAAKLGPLTLAKVELNQVELSNASIQRLVARRVTWRTCRAIGLRLSVDHASDLSIEDCRLDYSTVHFEKVKGGAVFRACSFREASIGGDLSGIRFIDCDFVDTEFRATKASTCDLRNSRLTSVRGLLSLRGAIISPDQAVGVATMIAAEAGLVITAD